MSSRELLEVLRGLAGCNLVGLDVVEVSPAYDHAELTGIAAAQRLRTDQRAAGAFLRSGVTRPRQRG
jgi:hypothetical protein